jgi:hypothetical protein
MNREELNQFYNSLRDERGEYSMKARKIEFKPIIPRLPEMKSDTSFMESVLTGFCKRFSNWKTNFHKFEQTKNEEQLV